MSTSAKPVAATAPAPVKASAPVKARVRTAPFVPENETPEARFKRIAGKRLGAVLLTMKRLETVGRSPGYKYTPEQAAALMQYLVDGLSGVKAAFSPRAAKADRVISL